MEITYADAEVRGRLRQWKTALAARVNSKLVH